MMNEVNSLKQIEINSLKQTLDVKEMEIEELKKIINGRIVEKGYGDTKWYINTSSILTKLIQEAGRWCERYASDLFILWTHNIENKLKDMSIESGTRVFAFRDSGVDGNSWYINHKDDNNYYRAIWFLDIEIDKEKNKIKMELHK